jgi:hypothetical protein
MNKPSLDASLLVGLGDWNGDTSRVLRGRHRAAPRIPRVFIPSRWGTFRLTDEPLDEPPKRLHKAWTEAALPNECLYVLSPGETRQQD